MKQMSFFAASLLCLTLPLAHAAQEAVTMHATSESGQGTELGTVRIAETPHGLAFYPDLKGLPSGVHGFHVHEKPSCEVAVVGGVKTPAGAAGEHYDPKATRKHGEPWGDGHLGDLPPLYVSVDGTSNTPVLAPRLKLSDVKGRSLMIHTGGDNHSDHPSPSGGGGPRVACGVIGR